MDEASSTWNPISYPYPILESSSIQSLDEPIHDKGKVTREANQAKEKEQKKKKKKKKEEVQWTKRGMCKRKAACRPDPLMDDEEVEGGKKKRGSQEEVLLCPNELHQSEVQENDSELGQQTQFIPLNVSEGEGEVEVEVEVEVDPHDQDQHPPSFHDFL